MRKQPSTPVKVKELFAVEVQSLQTRSDFSTIRSEDQLIGGVTEVERKTLQYTLDHMKYTSKEGWG